MTDAFYGFLVRCSGWLGLWVVRAAASVIAVGYFLLLPRRLGHSIRTYLALFPERGWVAAVVCAFRQYQDFASVYAERLEKEADISFEHEGQEHLRGLPSGAVLLMSHFGRWELAARRLPSEFGRLVVVMGKRREADEPVPTDLSRGGVDVRATSEAQAEASGIFDAVQAIRQGSLVSMAADRAWGASRTMRLPFLGREVALNMAPFALAHATGTPLLTVFAYRVGPRRYRFTCSPPYHVRAPSRAERDSALRQAATEYLARLEQMMRAYPEQWHSFGPFLLAPGDDPVSSSSSSSSSSNRLKRWKDKSG